MPNSRRGLPVCLPRARVSHSKPAPVIHYRKSAHQRRRHEMNGTNRNGSGNGVHRDAAIVNGHDPVSSDLLWDGLSPAVANALEQPLDPGLVSQRKGRAGRTYSYIEGHTVIPLGQIGSRGLSAGNDRLQEHLRFRLREGNQVWVVPDPDDQYALAWVKAMFIDPGSPWENGYMPNARPRCN